MPDTRFPLPLFDRFLLHAAAQGKDTAVSLTVDLPVYLEMLARDVESLCNTRSSLLLTAAANQANNGARLEGADTEKDSLPPWAYGLPDWTSFPRTAETVSLLCAALHQSLTAFEPRLAKVRIRPAGPQDNAEWDTTALAPTEGLRLRVDACLSVRENVRLVLLLHLSENTFSASEIRYGF